jgi:hypothetical protein
MHGFFTEKWRDFQEFLSGLLCGQLHALAGIIQALRGHEFFTIIIERSLDPMTIQMSLSCAE